MWHTHSGKLINFKENVIMKFEHKFAKLENIIPNYILRSRKTNTFILSHAEMRISSLFLYIELDIQIEVRKNRKHIAGRHFHGGGRVDYRLSESSEEEYWGAKGQKLITMGTLRNSEWGLNQRNWI